MEQRPTAKDKKMAADNETKLQDFELDRAVEAFLLGRDDEERLKHKRDIEDQLFSEIQSLKETVVTELALVRQDLAKCVAMHSPQKSRSFQKGSYGVQSDSNELEVRDSTLSRPSTNNRTSTAVTQDYRRMRRDCHRGRRTVRTDKEEPEKKKSKLLPLSGLNTEQIKEKVRNDKINQRQVEDEYRKSGFCQLLVRNPVFDHLTCMVIIANGIWIAIDVDFNDAGSITDAETVYVLADIMFYAFFTLEVLIRLAAFKTVATAFKNGWWLFDFALVILYTIDPFVLGFIEMAVGGAKLNLPIGVLRLCRLARLSRLSKLLTFFPELVIMIKGLFTALATVACTLGLLGMVTYVFAIAVRSIVRTKSQSQIEELYFHSVLEAIHRLLLHGAFMDSLSQFILKIKQESLAIFILTWIYIALSAVLIVNMLVGIFCEVISGVATQEKEIMLTERVQANFTYLLNKYDTNGSGCLSWNELADLLEDTGCQLALKKVDVDLDTLIDMAEDMFLYSSNGTMDEDVEVTYAQFIHLLLDLRNSQTATVKDVLAVGKRLNIRFSEIQSMLEGFLRAPSPSVQHAFSCA